jgi:hypothetical protein
MCRGERFELLNRVEKYSCGIYLSFEFAILTIDIEFTTHALERMRKYGVDKATVEKDA